MNTEKLIHDIKNGNLKQFRNEFGSLSFDEVARIYKNITPHFGEQRHFNFKYIKQAAEEVGLEGLVVELGSHDGELAKQMLPHFLDIDKWIGYDVCEAAVSLDHPKYKLELLTDWFHSYTSLVDVDVFVSTHTLEHMDSEAVYNTLLFVSGCRINKIILEIPFRKTGNWNGSKSAHILQGHSDFITILLQQLGYEVVHHSVFQNNHVWGAVR